MALICQILCHIHLSTTRSYLCVFDQIAQGTMSLRDFKSLVHTSLKNTCAFKTPWDEQVRVSYARGSSLGDVFSHEVVGGVSFVSKATMACPSR